VTRLTSAAFQHDALYAELIASLYGLTGLIVLAPSAGSAQEQPIISA
jgi:hypothetical protein